MLRQDFCLLRHRDSSFDVLSHLKFWQIYFLVCLLNQATSSDISNSFTKALKMYFLVAFWKNLLKSKQKNICMLVHFMLLSIHGYLLLG